MAISLVSKAFELSLRGHGLHNAQGLKLTLAGIADCADHETCEGWPGYDRLAGVADCDRRTAIRHVAALVALKLVLIVSKGGPRKANVYRLLLPLTPDWAAYETWLSENSEATSDSLPLPESGTYGDSLPPEHQSVTSDSGEARLVTETPRLVTETGVTSDTALSPEPLNHEPEPLEPSARARATPTQPGREEGILFADKTTQALRDALQELLPLDDWAAWGRFLTVRALSPQRIVLGGVPSKFWASRISKQFDQVVREVVRKHLEPALGQHATLVLHLAGKEVA